MDREQLYSLLPTSCQNLVCSLEGWRITQRRYNYDFDLRLTAAEQRANLRHAQWLEYRNMQLLAYLRHVVTTVPYYQTLFNRLGLHIQDIKTIEDYSQFVPILTKTEVQDNYSHLLSSAVKPEARIINHTSGTTGGGLRFATTWPALREQWAIWWRYRRWHGINLDMWCGYFAGRSVVPPKQQTPPFWRYNYPGRQILFSGYHMSAQHLGDYVAELQRRQPLWLHGYPSLLTLLAGYLVENKIDLGYQVRVITIGAENLLSSQKEVIQQAFAVMPKQHYGMAEAVANASECEVGNLHIDEDFAFMEFIKDPVANTYRIIGTNYTNPVTPFLRYDVGDIGSLSNHPCVCGRPGRIIESLDGRKEDYVVLKNGARIGRMDHVFKDLMNIREAQIYQSQPGKIELRIVPSSRYTDLDEKQLLQETTKRLGEDMVIQVTYRKELPRSRTGKLRFVVSELEAGQL